MERTFEPDYRLTVEEYHALTDEAPDDERWELIEGEPVLNAAPSRRHQTIVQNVIVELGNRRREIGEPWIVIPGIGVRHPDDSLNEPAPDVAILPPTTDDTEHWTHDILVAFEVLSPWSLRRDMVTNRNFYTRLAPLTHYVVLAQDAMRAHVFAREADFEGRELTRADATIAFADIDTTLRLGDVYRDVSV